MSKEIIDEIDFPDDIISFMKIKFPKAYTDQEKSALKQIESLAEEKKELKELLSKKRDQEKVKIIPINVAACEEAKEKAIKLVQEGALNLSARNKLVDSDDLLFDASNSSSTDFPQLKSKVRNKSEYKAKGKSNITQKILFVSAGYAFKDVQMENSEDSSEINTKRQISAPMPSDNGPVKKLRHISRSPSDSDEADQKSKGYNVPISEHLRICGHNLSVEFIHRMVEPYGSLVSIDIENRTDGMTPNVLVTMDSVEAAVAVWGALDSKFIEGRFITVFYKREKGALSFGRPYRRRRFRDNFRSRDRLSFLRNSSFPPTDNDKVLPSHFYSANVDNDGVKQRPTWSGNDDIESSESAVKVLNSAVILTKEEEVDRGLVVYDDFPKDFESDNEDDALIS